jgi:hypothetical protein
MVKRAGITAMPVMLMLAASPSLLAQWDVQSDTWVATDALGRSLPEYRDCGPPRANRTVGIFYFLWHGQHNPSGPWDITKILAQYPNAITQSTSPPWGPEYHFHHWGESELGYYLSSDPYVIRRHCRTLVDAGIDTLIFDVTNQFTYASVYLSLCNIYNQIRQAGGRTPQICFFGRVTTMQVVYDEFYSQNLYPDLWFQWKGKPLYLLSKAFPEDPPPNQTLQDFFTIRDTWAFSRSGWFADGHDKWTWADHYPQAVGWHDPGVPEEISVAVAMQETYMSAPTAHGRHYHDGSEPPPELWNGHGLNFQEQWERALTIDPEFVFITGWNEWVAQRFISDGSYVPAGYSCFVDQFTQEFSRDAEPMKGGHGDNYYYQMIDYIRRYKGVRRREYAGVPRPITIDGVFSDWTSVTPEFRDAIGDTTHRNYAGWAGAGIYVNTTGRNDIVAAKVTQDADYVYFYARTQANLTSRTGSKWMLLFIDADRNLATGWEGFDYLVNDPVVSSTQTSLKKYQDGAWESATNVPFRMSGKELEIRISRADLGLRAGADLTLDFHWADNIQKLGDIAEFGINGDSAPNRRFNYRYVADFTPPGPPTDLTASRTGTSIELSWMNPPDTDLSRVVVRYGTNGFPTGPDDGLLVCEHPALPGSQDACPHDDLVRGTTYYYAVFSSDELPHYSPAAQIEVYVPTPADLDADGDVDQSDYGLFQPCMSGSGAVSNLPGCRDARLDPDADVDQTDLTMFLACMSGPGTPADPQCLE